MTSISGKIDGTEDAALRRLANSDGWKEAKVQVVREIVSLLDISNLPLGDEKALAIEVAARKQAAVILQEFLNRIEGARIEAEDTFQENKNEEVSHIRIIE